MKKILFLLMAVVPGFLCAATLNMSADMFLLQRQKNAAVFDDANIGTRFQISGEIYAIKKSVNETEKPSALYMVEITGQKIIGKSLRLFFKNKKEIASLEKGQQLTAICVYKGITDRGLAAPSFYECSLPLK